MFKRKRLMWENVYNLLNGNNLEEANFNILEDYLRERRKSFIRKHKRREFKRIF